MGDPNGKALIKMAQADASALADLAEEIREELLENDPDVPDTELVLPLCKEIQGKAQAIANRTEEAAKRRPQSEVGDSHQAGFDEGYESGHADGALFREGGPGALD